MLSYVTARDNTVEVSLSLNIVTVKEAVLVVGATSWLLIDS